MTPYDHSALYDEAIAPLMDRLIAICETYAIPMIATFADGRRADGGYSLRTTVLPFDGWQCVPPTIEAMYEAHNVLLKGDGDE